MLNTIQIRQALQREETFIGVYPIDLIPTTTRVPCTLVINLDRHFLDGSHWVALSINSKRQAHLIESFGRPPQKNILTFIERNAIRGYIFNRIRFQVNESIACGYFCILFVLMYRNLKKFYKILQKCNHLKNEIVTITLIKRYCQDKFP